ncbi:uncharacterized protein LOC105185176 [Harpegnathos saltator]|uniref:uncharacterized protein LOC105185176 n=1 Tax=Harpegnathos saltator TaxID=610380 RepID=UPI0005910573|nr:uncharacterized protein LOC105185176 [Harpegnathos saltator]XP_025161907.1 uncharacterized protein LOC105185176 [Harpegnathos saltator]
MFAQRKIDPELEKLRNEVDGPPNLDTVTLNIQRKSSRIHAAFLFEHIGKPMLQKLCLLLSSTATGKIYNGWQEFAAHMGLTMEQIRCIDYDFKGLQDPTYYVLLTFVQSSDSTMDKILSALQKIERFDVICEIKDYVHNLVSAVSQDAIDELEIIHPAHIPRAPLVLSPILTKQGRAGVAKSESKNTPQDNQQKHTKQRYSCIVMLTFARDGLAIAECIAKIFRSKQPPIGVLILQEQEKGVYSRAEEFIDDCFRQVDYIIPILTKGYIETVNNIMKAGEKIHTNLDMKYLKYIYSLLRYEYMTNECCNNRVRCIVPDKDVYTVVRANLHPTLQAWFRESDIDDFVNNILLHKF